MLPSARGGSIIIFSDTPILRLMYKQYFGDLFIHPRWYFVLSVLIVLFILSFFLPFLFQAVIILTLAFFSLTLVDYILLFFSGGQLVAERILPARMNLGDENEVRIRLRNQGSFRAAIMLIDELPLQVQERDFSLNFHIPAGGSAQKAYTLRPASRGEYTFGRLLCYVSSPLRLLRRRRSIAATNTVKVYPSVKYLRQYQLLAQSDHRQFHGIRKIRRLGHSMEFEQIKEYVNGDDLRSINWTATARRNSLMVNHYSDARSQPVYCIIDKGRSMKMPFDGLSLLDYAINAALLFLHVALLKQDKAGLITFAGKLHDVVPAEKTRLQMHRLNETLYHQTTRFDDSNYEALSVAIFRKITQRSFLLFFTNFETMIALERQLPYLRQLASRHLVCVVIFQNTLLKEIHEAHPDNMEGIYIKTIADRFQFEKKQIEKELRRYGIVSLLTTPQALSVDIVNKYLELKARQQI